MRQNTVGIRNNLPPASAGGNPQNEKTKGKKMKDALKVLENYFELTQEPNEDGTTDDNPEWDKGFQAAMAIIRNQIK